MNLPAYDPKYTDRDVRENENLVALAYDYLYSYGGDFDFLVVAKQALVGNGNLPVATVRGVLNCMRADPRLSRVFRREVPTFRVVERRRPYRIRLKTTWNMPYATSSWRRAFLVHLLDEGRSELYYYTQDGRFEWHIVPQCNGKMSLLVPINYVPEGRTFCTNCIEGRI